MVEKERRLFRLSRSSLRPHAQELVGTASSKQISRKEGHRYGLFVNMGKLGSSQIEL